MKQLIRSALLLALVTLSVRAGAAEQAAAPARTLSPAEIEQFLRTARIGPRKPMTVGVAGTESALMDDGTLQHKGHIATIDVTKTTFTTSTGTEINFRDSWTFNVAAYELAKLLDFHMLPPSVERTVDRQPVAVTWWIDDAMMEKDRVSQKIEPPDRGRWANQMAATRVFNQLIYNVDANQTNLLITKDWQVWMIDHSRAFRLMKTLQAPKDLLRSDRTVLSRMRGLTKPELTRALGRWLNAPTIDALLARRDKMVALFDQQIAARGEAAVLFDLEPR